MGDTLTTMLRRIKLMPLGLFVCICMINFGCGSSEGPPKVDMYEPDFGPPETLIVVEGSGYDDLLAINFNDDVPADFNPSFGTGNALLFRVPPNAPLGDNDIRIVTSEGETTFPFRVTLEAPKVSFFSPKSANEGETVYILGENFFEPLEVLFFDSIAGNIIYHQPDSLVVEVPAGVQRGRLKVKANGGSATTAENFFSTTDILINDFDGNGVRAETEKWLFYGSIDQNANDAIQSSNPDPIDNNFLKVSGTDPGSVWIGGVESHSNDPMVFENFGLTSDLNNTFVSMDINNNGQEKTTLIIVLAERGGSPNDFTQQIDIDWEGWENLNIPLNRFQDVDGLTVDPSKIRTVKLHLFNDQNTTQRHEINVDNLKFIQVN